MQRGRSRSARLTNGSGPHVYATGFHQWKPVFFPVHRIFASLWAVSSVGLERYFHTVEVRGSNPLQPTTLDAFRCGRLFTRKCSDIRLFPAVTIVQLTSDVPMPTYAYRCTTCGQTFDVFQPISAAPLETCIDAVCTQTDSKGSGKVERIITGGAGLIFNGSGFYITDYKRKSDSSSESPSSCASGHCACSTSAAE